MEEIGGFEVLNRQNINYIAIPKCASSTILKMLERKSTVGELPHGPRSHFGLVRHPIDRWVSGICQCYLGRVKPFGGFETFDDIKNSLQSTKRLKWFVHNTPHDAHTVRQCEHIPESGGEITWFKFDHISEMLRWLEERNVNVDYSICENSHINKNDEYQEIYNRVHAILEKRTDYKNFLTDYYQEDFNLYHNAL